MSKLTDDPKVATHVEREVTKAVKAERKRVVNHAKSVPLHEDKSIAKHQKSFLGQLLAGIKSGE